MNIEGERTTARKPPGGECSNIFGEAETVVKHSTKSNPSFQSSIFSDNVASEQHQKTNSDHGNISNVPMFMTNCNIQLHEGSFIQCKDHLMQSSVFDQVNYPENHKYKSGLRQKKIGTAYKPANDATLSSLFSAENKTKGNATKKQSLRTQSTVFSASTLPLRRLKPVSNAFTSSVSKDIRDRKFLDVKRHIDCFNHSVLMSGTCDDDPKLSPPVILSSDSKVTPLKFSAPKFSDVRSFKGINQCPNKNANLHLKKLGPGASKLASFTSGISKHSKRYLNKEFHPAKPKRYPSAWPSSLNSLKPLKPSHRNKASTQLSPLNSSHQIEELNHACRESANPTNVVSTRRCADGFKEKDKLSTSDTIEHLRILMPSGAPRPTCKFKKQPTFHDHKEPDSEQYPSVRRFVVNSKTIHSPTNLISLKVSSGSCLRYTEGKFKEKCLVTVNNTKTPHTQKTAMQSDFSQHERESAGDIFHGLRKKPNDVLPDQATFTESSEPYQSSKWLKTAGTIADEETVQVLPSTTTYTAATLHKSDKYANAQTEPPKQPQNSSSSAAFINDGKSRNINQNEMESPVNSSPKSIQNPEKDQMASVQYSSPEFPASQTFASKSSDIPIQTNRLFPMSVSPSICPDSEKKSLKSKCDIEVTTDENQNVSPLHPNVSSKSGTVVDNNQKYDFVYPNWFQTNQAVASESKMHDDDQMNIEKKPENATGNDDSFQSEKSHSVKFMQQTFSWLFHLKHPSFHSEKETSSDQVKFTESSEPYQSTKWLKTAGTIADEETVRVLPSTTTYTTATIHKSVKYANAQTEPPTQPQNSFSSSSFMNDSRSRNFNQNEMESAVNSSPKSIQNPEKDQMPSVQYSSPEFPASQTFASKSSDIPIQTNRLFPMSVSPSICPDSEKKSRKSKCDIEVTTDENQNVSTLHPNISSKSSMVVDNNQKYDFVYPNWFQTNQTVSTESKMHDSDQMNVEKKPEYAIGNDNIFQSEIPRSVKFMQQPFSWLFRPEHPSFHSEKETSSDQEKFTESSEAYQSSKWLKTAGTIADDETVRVLPSTTTYTTATIHTSDKYANAQNEPPKQPQNLSSSSAFMNDGRSRNVNQNEMESAVNSSTKSIQNPEIDQMPSVQYSSPGFPASQTFALQSSHIPIRTSKLFNMSVSPSICPDSEKKSRKTIGDMEVTTDENKNVSPLHPNISSKSSTVVDNNQKYDFVYPNWYQTNQTVSSESKMHDSDQINIEKKPEYATGNDNIFQSEIPRSVKFMQQPFSWLFRPEHPSFHSEKETSSDQVNFNESSEPYQSTKWLKTANTIADEETVRVLPSTTTYTTATIHKSDEYVNTRTDPTKQPQNSSSSSAFMNDSRSRNVNQNEMESAVNSSPKSIQNPEKDQMASVQYSSPEYPASQTLQSSDIPIRTSKLFPMSVSPSICPDSEKKSRKSIGDVEVTTDENQNVSPLHPNISSKSSTVVDNNQKYDFVYPNWFQTNQTVSSESKMHDDDQINIEKKPEYATGNDNIFQSEIPRSVKFMQQPFSWLFRPEHPSFHSEKETSSDQATFTESSEPYQSTKWLKTANTIADEETVRVLPSTTTYTTATIHKSDKYANTQTEPPKQPQNLSFSSAFMNDSRSKNVNQNEMESPANSLPKSIQNPEKDQMASVQYSSPEYPASQTFALQNSDIPILTNKLFPMSVTPSICPDSENKNKKSKCDIEVTTDENQNVSTLHLNVSSKSSTVVDNNQKYDFVYPNWFQTNQTVSSESKIHDGDQINIEKKSEYATGNDNIFQSEKSHSVKSMQQPFSWLFRQKHPSFRSEKETPSDQAKFTESSEAYQSSKWLKTAGTFADDETVRVLPSTTTYTTATIHKSDKYANTPTDPPKQPQNSSSAFKNDGRSRNFNQNEMESAVYSSPKSIQSPEIDQMPSVQYSSPEFPVSKSSDIPIRTNRLFPMSVSPSICPDSEKSSRKSKCDIEVTTDENQNVSPLHPNVSSKSGTVVDNNQKYDFVYPNWFQTNQTVSSESKMHDSDQMNIEKKPEYAIGNDNSFQSEKSHSVKSVQQPFSWLFRQKHPSFRSEKETSSDQAKFTESSEAYQSSKWLKTAGTIADDETVRVLPSTTTYTTATIHKSDEYVNTRTDPPKQPQNSSSSSAFMNDGRSRNVNQNEMESPANSSPKSIQNPEKDQMASVQYSSPEYPASQTLQISDIPIRTSKLFPMSVSPSICPDSGKKPCKSKKDMEVSFDENQKSFLLQQKESSKPNAVDIDKDQRFSVRKSKLLQTNHVVPNRPSTVKDDSSRIFSQQKQSNKSNIDDDDQRFSVHKSKWFQTNRVISNKLNIVDNDNHTSSKPQPEEVGKPNIAHIEAILNKPKIVNEKSMESMFSGLKITNAAQINESSNSNDTEHDLSPYPPSCNSRLKPTSKTHKTLFSTKLSSVICPDPDELLPLKGHSLTVANTPSVFVVDKNRKPCQDEHTKSDSENVNESSSQSFEDGFNSCFGSVKPPDVDKADLPSSSQSKHLSWSSCSEPQYSVSFPSNSTNQLEDSFKAESVMPLPENLPDKTPSKHFSWTYCSEPQYSVSSPSNRTNQSEDSFKAESVMPLPENLPDKTPSKHLSWSSCSEPQYSVSSPSNSTNQLEDSFKAGSVVPLPENLPYKTSSHDDANVLKFVKDPNTSKPQVEELGKSKMVNEKTIGSMSSGLKITNATPGNESSNSNDTEHDFSLYPPSLTSRLKPSSKIHKKVFSTKLSSVICPDPDELLPLKGHTLTVVNTPSVFAVDKNRKPSQDEHTISDSKNVNESSSQSFEDAFNSYFGSVKPPDVDKADLPSSSPSKHLSWSSCSEPQYSVNFPSNSTNQSEDSFKAESVMPLPENLPDKTPSKHLSWSSCFEPQYSVSSPSNSTNQSEDSFKAESVMPLPENLPDKTISHDDANVLKFVKDPNTSKPQQEELGKSNMVNEKTIGSMSSGLKISYATPGNESSNSNDTEHDLSPYPPSCNSRLKPTSKIHKTLFSTKLSSVICPDPDELLPLKGHSLTVVNTPSVFVVDKNRKPCQDEYTKSDSKNVNESSSQSFEDGFNSCFGSVKPPDVDKADLPSSSPSKHLSWSSCSEPQYSVSSPSNSTNQSEDSFKAESVMPLPENLPDKTPSKHLSWSSCSEPQYSVSSPSNSTNQLEDSFKAGSVVPLPENLPYKTISHDDANVLKFVKDPNTSKPQQEELGKSKMVNEKTIGSMSSGLKITNATPGNESSNSNDTEHDFSLYPPSLTSRLKPSSKIHKKVFSTKLSSVICPDPDELLPLKGHTLTVVNTPSVFAVDKNRKPSQDEHTISDSKNVNESSSQLFEDAFNSYFGSVKPPDVDKADLPSSSPSKHLSWSSCSEPQYSVSSPSNSSNQSEDSFKAKSVMPLLENSPDKTISHDDANVLKSVKDPNTTADVCVKQPLHSVSLDVKSIPATGKKVLPAVSLGSQDPSLQSAVVKASVCKPHSKGFSTQVSPTCSPKENQMLDSRYVVTLLPSDATETFRGENADDTEEEPNNAMYESMHAVRQAVLVNNGSELKNKLDKTPEACGKASLQGSQKIFFMKMSPRDSSD